jgi:hypothetical protein
MVKAPPFPAQDAYDRSDFIPTKISVAVPPGHGITNAVVAFGYLENSTTDQLYCTSRRETCIANSATVPGGLDPFFYPVEGVGGVESGLAGVPCRSNCAVAVPAITGRVLYYRIHYRDATNKTVQVGPLEAVVIP